MASHQTPPQQQQQQQQHGHPHGHPQRPPQLRQWTADGKENFNHSDPERWVCLYPAYFNKNKSKAEGRILPKEKCVANPTYLEIRDVLMQAGLKMIIENKVYPRERSLELAFRGRIRVQIKKDDGTILNDKFPTRRSVLLHLGEMIPQLKSRTGKGAEGAGGPQEAQQQQQQQAQGGGGQKKKKKGKK